MASGLLLGIVPGGGGSHPQKQQRSLGGSQKTHKTEHNKFRGEGNPKGRMYKYLFLLAQMSAAVENMGAFLKQKCQICNFGKIERRK
jgi:hypothetical protein